MTITSHLLCYGPHSWLQYFLSILFYWASGSERERAHLVVQLRLFFYIFIYIRVVRRALNLLRASFSPIFQYFSAVNVTRVSFSPVFQYFVTYVYVYVYVRIRYMYMYTYVRIRYTLCHAPRNCIVGHGFSTLNSSAMDSSAIGVGVAVLVGKCMQGP